MRALITGASSGIGEEIAKYLDWLGCETILVARRKDRLEELQRKLQHKSEIISLDVGKEDIEKAINYAIEYSFESKAK